MAPPRGGAPRPYPIQPLLDAAHITTGQLGRAVNANGTTITQAARDGLTLSQADRWAIRLHLMPEEIWPEFSDAPPTPPSPPSAVVVPVRTAQSAPRTADPVFVYPHTDTYRVSA